MPSAFMAELEDHASSASAPRKVRRPGHWSGMRPRSSGAKGSPLFKPLLAVAERISTSGVDMTVEDVRETAISLGVLTGKESRSELSVLGAVMVAAGLEKTDRFVRSSVPQSHGNLLRVWRRGPYRMERAA